MHDEGMHDQGGDPTQSPLPQTISRTPVPAWAIAVRYVTQWVSQDCGGGPRLWRLAWVINFQKGATFLFLGMLMWHYRNNSAAAWIYLAMHGSYGVVWVLKALAFPDSAWQIPVTVLGGINSFVFVLGLYWVFGWLLISGTAQPSYPLPVNAWYCLCISLCFIGSVLMTAADAQKFFSLRVRPALITDGLYRYVRHPNYLGEMMVYGSLAMMVWHWFPPLVLIWVWTSLFAVNMIFKEASMSRYPGWADYKRRTWWLVPWLF